MSSLFSYLHANATQLLDFWLTMQLQTATYALLVMLVERLLPERWSTPRLRYLLWSTVLLKALIPPVISMPGGEVLPSAAFMFSPVEAITTNAFTTAPAGLPFPMIALLLILASSLILAGIALWRAISLRRTLRDALPFDDAPAGDWPPIFISECIPSPLATGIRNPRIYITSAIAQAPPRILHAVLEHERAHIRRRDAIVVILQTLVQIVYVLNPLMWMANLRLFRYRELICDDEALRSAGTRPQDYGRLLIDFAEAQPSRLLQTGTCFFETRRGFVQRISELFNAGNRAAMQWKHYVLVVIFSLIILPLSWQCAAPVVQEESLVRKEPLMYQATFSFNKERALDGERARVGSSIDSRTEPVPESEFAGVSQPEMLGGLSALQKHVVYPEEALADSPQGTVIVEAEIVGDGPPAYVSVVRSVHPALDKAAKAAVSAMYFTAGRSRGRIVTTSIAIPIKFKLK
jgi:TonB family protein